MARKRAALPKPVDKFECWASFARGILSTSRPDVRPPLHPVLQDAYYDGRSAVVSGHAVVGDPDALAALIAHVWAGNPPHTHRP